MQHKLSVLLILILATVSISSAQEQSATLAGYGDIQYNDVIYEKGIDYTPGEIELQYFNLFVGNQFNHWISFQSELSLKNSIVEPGKRGRIALNQAYIDLRILPELGIRGGLMLVPFGLTNLNRNPTNFHGVRRPNVERYIIPATWREMGIGVQGESDLGFDYEVYAMTGLEPSGITGANGIRGARQNGYKASTSNIAFSSRITYQLNSDLKLGASYYLSTIKNKIASDSSEQISALNKSFYNMGEGHVQFQKNNFEARGLFALGRILGVEKLNDTFGNAAGQIQSGGYVELAYNFLPSAFPLSEQQLFIFVRGESYDTNFVTGKISRNNEYLREELTFGFTYKPIQRIVLKTDFQFLTSLGTKYIEQLNVAVAYSF